MTVTELDLLGPAGDNISFGTKADSTAGGSRDIRGKNMFMNKRERERNPSPKVP